MIGWLRCMLAGGHKAIPHYDPESGHYLACARCPASWRPKQRVAA